MIYNEKDLEVLKPILDREAQVMERVFDGVRGREIEGIKFVEKAEKTLTKTIDEKHELEFLQAGERYEYRLNSYDEEEHFLRPEVLASFVKVDCYGSAHRGTCCVLGEVISPEILEQKGLKQVLIEKLIERFPEKAKLIIPQLMDMLLLSQEKSMVNTRNVELDEENEFVDTFKRGLSKMGEERKRLEAELAVTKKNAKDFRKKVFDFLKKHPMLAKLFLKELKEIDGPSQGNQKQK